MVLSRPDLSGSSRNWPFGSTTSIAHSPLSDVWPLKRMGRRSFDFPHACGRVLLQVHESSGLNVGKALITGALVRI